MDFVLAAVMLLSLVLVHEVGHFYVAVFHGIRPKAFSFGFGPAVWRTERRGTTYQVGLFPLGGFVLFDQGDLESRPVVTRLAVTGGGIAAQIVLALLLMGAVYGAWGVPAATGVAVAGVEGPAARAGLVAGERVIAIDGTRLAGANALDLAAALLVRADRKDAPVRLSVELPSGARRSVDVTPSGHRLGLALATRTVWSRYPSFLRREALATEAVGGFLQAEAQGFAALATGRASLADVSGPVGLVRTTSAAVGLGPPQALGWAALLSANLALVNFLPVPGLDGGHVVLLLVEWLRGRRLNATLEAAVQGAGLALVLLFALVITMHDVAVLIGG